MCSHQTIESVNMFMANNSPINTEEIKKYNIFSDVDIIFARFIYNLSDNKPEELFWTTLLLSYCCTSEGHVCLDIENIAAAFPPGIPINPSLTLSPVNKLSDILTSCSVIGNPADFRPLILEGQLLYLNKFWNYESYIAKKLTGLAKDTIPIPDPSHCIRLLDDCFPQKATEINWQRVAAYCAATKRLCIITGGPGTGKTTTVVHILSLLLELEKNKKLRIALAAPTGKAAARMDEALQKAKDGFKNRECILNTMSLSASTMHRLLGTTQNSGNFIHGPGNPLPVDIAVVDEASMIDLSLLARFLSALPDLCRLILVGDRDQLASVEAGAVFGDICSLNNLRLFSKPFYENCKQYLLPNPSDEKIVDNTIPLSDCIVELTKIHRFTGTLALCSKAVKNGDAETAFSIITQSDSPEVSWKDLANPKLIPGSIKEDIIQHWREYLESDTIERRYAAFNNFRIFCALRSGPFGVEGINRLIENILSQEGLLSPDKIWYDKKPIMITRNDYQMNLYNGDTGIIVSDPASEGKLRAWFPVLTKDSKKAFRSFAVSRLPAHETAFAITVHKSQGAEFDSIMLLLPDADSPILTRELIYTAITRARTKIKILGKPDIFKNAVSRKISRKSGLREKLWGK